MTTTYTINCVIAGENREFLIKIASSETVHSLKKMIKEENPIRFVSVDAYQLDLYQVNISGKRNAKIAQLKKMAGDLDWQEELLLNPSDELAEIYPKAPPKGTIHIIVQPPKSDIEQDDQVLAPQMKRTRSPPFAVIDNSTAQRSSTVDALYQRLNYYRFVMVRGTPACGKSTLAQLLEKHIRTKEPTTNPIPINTWTRDASGWAEKLTENYNPDGPNTIIIDEAQLTYWDDGFWNGFLKSITRTSANRVILFVSYGSPTARVSEVVGTPIYVPECNRIGLRPVDHPDGIPPAGLLLPVDEFSAVVKTVFPTGRFTRDFLEYVFRLTAGHVGAVHDLLEIVMADTSYRQLKYDVRDYSLETFQSQFPITELWSRLDSSRVFRRGLPLLSELQELPITRVFRKVLSNNYVTKKTLKLQEDQDALDQCFKEGWLHATTNQAETLYIFTTPLHQWFVEYYLGTVLSDPTSIGDGDLRTFAIKVIRRFSPLQLSSQRKIGASNVQRPLEAQFQDEFYRCCHEYSKGSVIAFPEYGSASGRVDFYIPSKKWGVELLRDGDRLDNHYSRFIGPGAYAEMELEDYIILDFRTSRPQKGHPGMPKLYHVVFENNFKQIEIQEGSSLQMVEKFELLNHN